MIICASQLFTREGDLISAKTTSVSSLGNTPNLLHSAWLWCSHPKSEPYRDHLLIPLELLALIATSSAFISFEHAALMHVALPVYGGKLKPLGFWGESSFFQSFIIISSLHRHLKWTMTLNLLQYNINKYVIFIRHVKSFCLLNSSCHSHISSGP